MDWETDYDVSKDWLIYELQFDRYSNKVINLSIESILQIDILIYSQLYQKNSKIDQ